VIRRIKTIRFVYLLRKSRYAEFYLILTFFLTEVSYFVYRSISTKSLEHVLPSSGHALGKAATIINVTQVTLKDTFAKDSSTGCISASIREFIFLQGCFQMAVALWWGGPGEEAKNKMNSSRRCEKVCSARHDR